MNIDSRIIHAIEQSIITKQHILAENVLLNNIQLAANNIVATFKNGGKVLFCGNGGSAADAQHLAAELSGRFYLTREPLFAEALHVNTSYLTAIANDFSFEVAYARLVKAYGVKGDILCAFSTSGNSLNIINALKEAKEIGMCTIGFTGENGGKCKEFCDILLNIPSKDTPRIQESHILVGHIICELVESAIFQP